MCVVQVNILHLENELINNEEHGFLPFQLIAIILFTLYELQSLK